MTTCPAYLWMRGGKVIDALRQLPIQSIDIVGHYHIVAKRRRPIHRRNAHEEELAGARVK